MLSHRAIVSLGAGTLASGTSLRRRRFLHAAPMFHLADLALWVGADRSIGGTHIIVPGVRAGRGHRPPSSEHSVTHVLLVPTMIQMLRRSPARWRSHDLSSLRADRLRRVADRRGGARAGVRRPAGVGFMQAYGMTELVACSPPLRPADHRDAGPGGSRLPRRAARRRTEVRIVDERRPRRPARHRRRDPGARPAT